MKYFVHFKNGFNVETKIDFLDKYFGIEILYISKLTPTVIISTSLSKKFLKRLKFIGYVEECGTARLLH